MWVDYAVPVPGFYTESSNVQLAHLLWRRPRTAALLLSLLLPLSLADECASLNTYETIFTSLSQPLADRSKFFFVTGSLMLPSLMLIRTNKTVGI